MREGPYIWNSLKIGTEPLNFPMGESTQKRNGYLLF